MEVIDLVLAVPLLYGMYRGFRKGFLMEVVNILALVLALIGGFKLMDQAMVVLVDVFGKPGPFLPFLAFILVFIGIVLGVNILGRAMKGLIGLTILGSVDKFIGSLIGLLKYAFAVSLVLWLIDTFDPDVFGEQLKKDAFLLPFLIGFTPMVFNFLLGFLPFLGEMMDSIRDLLSSDSASHH
jgi:membrane protein required for colicin V production